MRRIITVLIMLAVAARAQVLEAAATVTSKGGAKLSLVSAVAAIKASDNGSIGKPVEEKALK